MPSNNQFDQILLQRRKKFLANFNQTKTSVLFSCPADIEYFCGFSNFLVPTEREAFLYLSQDCQTDLIASFFSLSKKIQGVNFSKGCHGTYLQNNIKNLVSRDQATSLFVDYSSLFVDELKLIQQTINLNIFPLNKNLVWSQRLIKDQTEKNKISQAKNLNKKLLAKITNSLVEGVSEKQLAVIFESECKKYPHAELAFPIIIAFGHHSANPHHQPSHKKLKSETVVLIDCGVKYQGYCSDMTRTIWFGKNPTQKFLKVEAVVKNAYRQAKKTLLKVKQGQAVSAAQLDQAARQVITSAGFGAQFTHTTGHGLGLEIHEPPSLNGQNPVQLKSNMIITIEPGIYLEGKFGYRHENTIIV